MRFRFPPWLVTVSVAAFCAAILFVVAKVQSRELPTEEMFARLPTDRALVLYIDFNALREAGLLKAFAGSDVVQEPEYRAFVDQTGFDYMEDLEAAMVSFHPNGKFFLVRGSFDWKSLKAYALKQGGKCLNLTCQLEGSTEERQISFFPLQQKLMALAVSPDPTAADRAKDKIKPRRKEFPAGPVWAIIDPAFLKDNSALPEGTRIFARPLENAEEIVLSAGAEGDGMEVRLSVTCHSASDASILVSRLSAVTSVLRGMIAKESKTPGQGDLSGVLAAGAFRHEDRRVFGRWPLHHEFLTSLAGRPAL